jgi:hypothetical protein
MDSPDGLELAHLAELAEITLRSLERKYFRGIEPVSSIEIVDDPTKASCYLPQLKTIQLNCGLARFPRLVQFLTLHELIHHKLATEDPNYISSPYGNAFRRETKELFGRGAYDDLL